LALFLQLFKSEIISKSKLQKIKMKKTLWTRGWRTGQQEERQGHLLAGDEGCGFQTRDPASVHQRVPANFLCSQAEKQSKDEPRETRAV
jgi:hypothetical protein